MKKRVLSLFLAVVMIMTMLPTTALAAASFPPKDGRYWENLTEDEAVELLENTKRSGSYVFVYYSDTCGNSQREVPRMADYAADQGILVYGYNCKGRDNRVSTVIARQTGWTQIGWPVAIAANFDEDPILSYAVKSATLNGFITALEHCLLVDDDTGGFTSSDSVTLLYDDSVSAKEWDVLRLTNRHRMELGLRPLTTTDKMQMAANQRAYELTEAYNADHTRPDGSKCYTALDDYGISGYTVAAENIAYNFTSAASVVDAWLNSDGHRANIERGDLTHLGVGEDSRYWSQDFIGGSCSYSNLSLSPSRVNAKLGQDLEALLETEDVTLTAACSKHGASSLPVIADMCSGYRPNTPGAQSVTVSLGGRTATLTVNVDGSCAKHTFDKGVVTTAPTCVTEGLRTYTCTACGAVETEIIPMLPHSPDANGKCTVCGFYRWLTASTPSPWSI